MFLEKKCYSLNILLSPYIQESLGHSAVVLNNYMYSMCLRSRFRKATVFYIKGAEPAGMFYVFAIISIFLVL